MNKNELKDYKREYYILNRDRILERERLRRLNSSERINLLRRNVHRRNPQKELYRAAKARSKRKEIEFSIELDDIIIPEFCPILLIPLKVGDGKIQDSSPSLDRIDNSLGYIKGNIQVISNLANRMKNSASDELLINFAKWIIKEKYEKSSSV